MTNRDEIVGTVWLFGDHVNTDVIHPPDYFSLDPAHVKAGLFAKFDPTLQARFTPNDVIVGGRNFGCGSSRETSIRSLLLNGVGAIVAVDFARIFFRNATNNGIRCLTFRDAGDVDRIPAGRRATISLANWTIVPEGGEPIALAPASAFIRTMWEAGGLLELPEMRRGAPT